MNNWLGLEPIMDIYSKIFLTNIILIFTVEQIDTKLLNNKIEKMPSIEKVTDYWTYITWISIPVWLISLILKS